MKTLPRSLVTVLLIALLYYSFFIVRSSFNIFGEHYFCLFDDGMISMQYAKNLANGNGLTWNPGEKIEGITNPLWTCIMAIPHLFGIPLQFTSLAIQCLGALILLIQCIVVWKICEKTFPGKSTIAIMATILSAFYLPLCTWSLMGMEVSILTLIVSFVLLRYIKTEKSQPSSAYLSIILLGLSTLIRLDMVVPSMVFIMFYAFRRSSHRLRFAVYSVSIVLFFIAVQTLWRYYYFGEFLPNTYYLKMTGLDPLYRITRGMFTSAKFILFMNPLLFMLPCYFVFKKRQSTLTIMLTLFVAQIAYSTYVGGDAWDWWGGANRYISIATAPFFILLAASLEAALQVLGRRFPTFYNNRAALYPLVVLFTLIQLNFQRDGSSLLTWLLITKPFGTSDNIVNVTIAKILEKTPKNATIATVTAGSVHYFCDRTMFDILGKNDKYISRMDAKFPPNSNKYISFHPGHNKYDYHYSVIVRKADVVVGLDENNSEVEKVLKDYKRNTFSDLVFYTKQDSPYLEEFIKRLQNSTNN